MHRSRDRENGMSYIIPILLAVLVARIGRFFASTGSTRPEHWEKTWRCDSTTEVSSCGAICHRIRGHWGSHRTASSGALGWYHEWKGEGKVVRVIGLGKTYEVRDRHYGGGTCV
jgi:hypothetical protein